MIEQIFADDAGAAIKRGGGMSAPAFTSLAPIDRVVFGDNQFFGINHMSQEKAQERAGALCQPRQCDGGL